jgi:PAS domain S-box-containing protein
MESLGRSDPDRADFLAPALWKAIQEKLDELRLTVQFARHGKIPLAVAIISTNRGRASMDRIQDIAGEIEERLDQSLEVTRTRSRRYVRSSELTVTVGSAGIFLIVLLSSMQVQRLISMRSQLTRKLTRSVEDFRILADSVPQMVWRTGESGDLNYVNQEWIRFSGSVGDGNPTAWHEFIHPQDRDRIIRQWHQARELQMAYAMECRLKERSIGKYRWFLFQARPVSDARDNRLQWYVTFTDIDEQKATQRLLLQANDELNQFAFAAAHDLQEPLRNIHVALNMFIRHHGWPSDETAKGWIEESMNSAKRMHTMIKDLLAYSRAIDPENQTELPANSEACLGLAIANLDTAMKQAGGRIIWESLPQVNVSQTHLVQLFQNLISNALKYRKRDVPLEIKISAQRQGEDWEFSVNDNGIGFEQEYATRIFGVFKRLHGRKYEGTGMGLAICARIVAHYGGRIWAESTSQKGATFVFTLSDHGHLSERSRATMA